jgi:hypothetical protein
MNLAGKGNTRVYPKVSGLAARSLNCKWHSFLPLDAVVSLFCEFCRHNPLWRRSLVTADQTGQSAAGLGTEPPLGLLIRCLHPWRLRSWVFWASSLPGWRVCLYFFFFFFFFFADVSLFWYSDTPSLYILWRPNPLCCFWTSVYCCCCCLFRYGLSPETFGHTLVFSYTECRLSLVLWKLPVLCSDPFQD